MYKRTSQGWLKHLDFIILDELCLQIAFVLAYWLRHMEWNVYSLELYRSIALMFALFDLLIAIVMDTMHNVVKRGYYNEFAKTFKHCLLVSLLTVLWTFTFKSSDAYSRTVVFLTFLIHLGLGYGVRLLWKRYLIRRSASDSGKQAMLAVLEPDLAEKMIARLTGNPVEGYHLTGIVLTENPNGISSLPSADGSESIPVVCAFPDAAQYICREWIDSVFISCKGTSPEVRTFMGHCAEMGVTIHYHVPGLGLEGTRQLVEKVGGSTVLTTSVNYVSPAQLILKRLTDILGGLIGSVFALIVIAILAPFIKKASPGPVLYRSERIGQNGKRFRMIKIRSMYLDAEERKQSLMSQNRVKDGMMFKLDFDPRIIGNEILPDGTRKTGIGDFIRRTSLDEFPQFFNVLKGDMSLVGTRPPTPDEWEKYEYHHRARLAIKPGITGLWQVSGRSSITDFEQVVDLDTRYIQEWNFGMDIKILIQTIIGVFKKDGAL